MDQRLKFNSESYTIPEENKGISQDLGLGHAFLDITPKSQVQNKR